MPSRVPAMLAVLLLAACQSAPIPEERPDRVLGTGEQRDAHGCLRSAGYIWCPERQGCVRPWELKPQEDPEMTSREAFEKFCKPDQ